MLPWRWNSYLAFSHNAYGFIYNGAPYYYFFNHQGDVIHIMGTDGGAVASYSYDEWGYLLSVTGNTTIANLNPIRYREFYYDTETGFYYVSSRYYDPEIGRFINADTTDILTATPMGLTDKNLFAYCDNNSVVRGDHGGQFWDTVFDVVSLGISIIDVVKNPDDLGLGSDLLLMSCLSQVLLQQVEEQL